MSTTIHDQGTRPRERPSSLIELVHEWCGSTFAGWNRMRTGLRGGCGFSSFLSLLGSLIESVGKVCERARLHKPPRIPPSSTRL